MYICENYQPMSVPTQAEFIALTFGYLTGGDLFDATAPQFLIKKYTEDQDAMQRYCNMAYAELRSNLANRYDVDYELSLTGDQRDPACVRITSILAARAILWNSANISEKDMANFAWVDKQLTSIRSGQMNLKLRQPQQTDGTPKPNYSDAAMVASNFQTLG